MRKTFVAFSAVVVCLLPYAQAAPPLDGPAALFAAYDTVYLDNVTNYAATWLGKQQRAAAVVDAYGRTGLWEGELPAMRRDTPTD